MTKKTILVIDDHDRRLLLQEGLYCNEMAQQFSLRNPQVMTFEEVSAAADDPSIAAIITDNHMHGKDRAVEICKLLRKKPHLANVPIYVHSGEVSKGDHAKIQEMGIKVFSKNDDGSINNILCDIKGKVLPTHLPADHRTPGTPGAGEVTR